MLSVLAGSLIRLVQRKCDTPSCERSNQISRWECPLRSCGMKNRIDISVVFVHNEIALHFD